MNNKKRLKFYIVITLLPFFIGFCKNCLGFQIAFERPDLIYKGDKTVKEEEIINLGKILLRDLKKDEKWNYGGKDRLFKYFIVKKNHLSKKKLKDQLLEYCKEYYSKNNNYDEIAFFFYEECGTMPWYWNNEGFFPDLEMNSEHRIAAFWVTEDNITFRDHY